MRLVFIAVGGIAAVLIAVPTGMIVFGTASAPPPVASLQTGDAVIGRERADLGPALHFKARDGTTLAYRAYPGAANRIAFLIHGSSGSSGAVHGLAKALQAAGITVYAPDMRGHGESGRKGDVDYVGQLEADLIDLIGAIGPVSPNAKRILIGHSSGGGFVLRFAGGVEGGRFDGYLLLSPYVAYDAPTVRPNAGGWAAPYVPRIIALAVLSRLGIHWLEGLPVVVFAVPPQDLTANRTPTYSFRLWANFSPHRDWRGDIHAIRRPAIVLVGANDELFRADEFAPTFHSVRADIPVEVVPGINHMEMVTAPAGRAAVIKAFNTLAAQ
jgi:non-heme chloroperoxidase